MNAAQGLNLDKIAVELLDHLKQNASEIVAPASLTSPRAVGDGVQDYLANTGLKEVMRGYGIKVDSKFSRRAMADMAFEDHHGRYYVVDVKTHNLDTDFNMPNLISVKRLSSFYEGDDKNNFCILVVEYKVSEGKIEYTNCHFKLIESFDWNCLTIGALGCGQIQIRNANNIAFDPDSTRKKWMLGLCTKLETFYDKEIEKINKRKKEFQESELKWKNK